MDFQLPQLGEGIYEADLVRWLVNPGDSVRPGQGLMEVLTDKATMEVPAPFGGTITELCAQSGKTIKVGDHILSYDPSNAVPEELPVPTPPVRTATHVAEAVRTAPARTGNGRATEAPAAVAVKASPSVRQLARKLGIDLVKRTSAPAQRLVADGFSRVGHIPDRHLI